MRKKQTVSEAEKPFLNTQEVCALLKVSRFWLMRHHAGKGGPPRYKFGGRVRYDKAALESWFMARKSVKP